MMRRILDDIEQAGYSELILWVFDSNMSAIRFYEAHSFAASGRKQPAFGARRDVCQIHNGMIGHKDLFRQTCRHKEMDMAKAVTATTFCENDEKALLSVHFV